MESTKESVRPVRFVLPLTKCRVTDVKELLVGQRIKIELGGSTTMTFEISHLADVRVGDLLTLYTEVLAKGQN